jgi:SAM-dependent methyltransferase
LDSGGDRELAEFERARRETVRYHEELYASATLGQAGTWLAKPHRLLADALALVSSGEPVLAYDLGAGIGRHTLPLLRELPAGSDVIAVDLLPSALRALQNAVPPDSRTRLRTRPADLDGFEFEAPADLFLAFSVIEHLRDLRAVHDLLERVRAATKPGGVVAIGIAADRAEVDDRGRRRPALLESAMSRAEATGLLSGVFGGFDVTYQRSRPAQVREVRGGGTYTLTSTLITWLATRPAPRRPSRAAARAADGRRGRRGTAPPSASGT